MASLDEMTDRYQAAGEGMAPVLGCRFQVLARVQGHDAAEEVYRAWTIAPRTPLSDCQSCEPGLRVWHLAAIGSDAEALGHAFPVLDHGGCADQPQRMIGHAVEPLLKLGMSARAAVEHLRGVRLLRERPGSTSTLGSARAALRPDRPAAPRPGPAGAPPARGRRRARPRGRDVAGRRRGAAAARARGRGRGRPAGDRVRDRGRRPAATLRRRVACQARPPRAGPRRPVRPAQPDHRGGRADHPMAGGGLAAGPADRPGAHPATLAAHPAARPRHRLAGLPGTAAAGRHLHRRR